MHDALCKLHRSLFMMHDSHLEPCMKDIGAWVIESMPKSSFIWGSNESSHFTVLHAVLILVLLESVQLDHEDELVEF